MRPRAWRWNSATLRLSSSELICRLTADCERFSVSPAWVKLPASATAWKILSLSQSIMDCPFYGPREPHDALCGPTSLRRLGGLVLVGGQETLSLQRRHAAHAGGGYRLAEHLVLHVAGGEHAGNLGRGAVRSCDEIALIVERQLALEELGRGRVADGDEEAVTGDLLHLPGLHVADPDAGNAGGLAGAQHFLDSRIPDDADLRIAEQALLHDLLGAQMVAA